MIVDDAKAMIPKKTDTASSMKKTHTTHGVRTMIIEEQKTNPVFIVQVSFLIICTVLIALLAFSNVIGGF